TKLRIDENTYVYDLTEQKRNSYKDTDYVIMACILKHFAETTIKISNYHIVDGTTFYYIHVTVGKVNWMVQHRFKEFVELNDKLVTGHGISSDLLPPKKVLGNRNPEFLVQRQHLLEIYLQKVLIFLRFTMCREFVEFLDFNKYDIIYLLQDISNDFYDRGEAILATSTVHEFTSLDLYAITERLKLPCPSSDNVKKKFDFSHVLDFCSQLQSLIVRPRKVFGFIVKYQASWLKFESCLKGSQSATTVSKIDHNTSIGTSNIVPENLKFDLNAFRSLKSFKMYGINAENICDAGLLRQTITQLSVHSTSTTQINQILLCDCIHKTDQTDATKCWNELTTANFSSNCIQSIDSTIQLLPKLKTLILDRNRITTISNLKHLPYLSSLSLCENYIADCVDCHLELGNLKTLKLSQNRLTSLIGFRKMYSLVTLDVSCNQIASIDEVDYVAGLPCLEELILTGNPVSGIVDYRQRVLSRFGDRCTELYLDNEKAEGSEIDMALVLAALKQSEAKPLLLQTSFVNENCGISVACGEIGFQTGECDVSSTMRRFLKLLACIHMCLGADILMVTMGGTKSHKIPFIELARGLIPRGHNVTFLNGFIADIHEIGLHEVTPTGLIDYIQNFTNWDLVGARMRGDLPVSVWDVLRYPFEACNAMFEDAETKELLNQKFDLLILDGAFPECSMGLVHKFQVPFMYINTVGFYTNTLSLAGNPIPYSVTPVFYSSFTDDMTIVQRAINIALYEFMNICHTISMSVLQQVLRKHVGELPNVYEMSKNVSFILQNGNAILTHSRPFLPNVAEIACIHCKPANPLPKDLEDFISASGDTGFIYVSMGSSVKAANMPEHLRLLFINTFAQLPYQILWKWEGPMNGATEIPPNVKLSRWLPQQDILGHRKLRAFVTHGGLLSLFESVYHGIPVVSMPVFCDHDSNTAKAVQDGYALKLDLETLTSDNLLKGIIKIIHDPKFRQAANFIQYYLIDIFGILIISMYIAIRFIRYLTKRYSTQPKRIKDKIN
ncbi:Nischarin, partial [Pseudolycoriella hygida]